MTTEELRVHIKTVADTKGFEQTQGALRSIQNQLRALSAFTGLGLPNAREILQSVVGTLGDSVNVLRDHERIARATSAAYGVMTGEWTRFATALSETTGFTSDSILEAALSARTLSQNYGLTIQQTQQLIKASADLARVRGIGLFEAFERVQSAIRGEAEASEYLGLTLNDTYLRNQAMNGSLRQTYDRMTDVQKAQVRYVELLRQSAQFSGLAAQSANSLEGAFGKAAKSGRELQLTLGEITKPAVITGLRGLAAAAEALNRGLTPDPRAEQFLRLSRDVLQRGGRNIPSLPARAQEVQADLARRNIEELNKLGVGLLLQAQTEAAATGTRNIREYIAKGMASVTERASLARGEERQLQTLRQIALQDQVEAAVRDINAALDHQAELQRRTVDLAAEEAQIRLSMLPAQQEMAELQRRMTEQQIRARQAALPATEALEDLRYLQQRAQLISQNRNVGVEQRIAARRELRAIGRALPGAELAALEAGRGVTLAGRAAERFGMEQQLFEISTQRQLEQITQLQTVNGYLSQIAAQRTQAIELTINLSAEDFQTEVFKQLVEAEKQAQGPTTIKLSGVRRGT